MKHLSVLKQVIKLAAIGQETPFKQKDCAEDFLHLTNVGPDGNLAAQVVANVLRPRDVVSMGMGFQNPFDLPVLAAHIFNDAIAAGAGEVA